MNTLVFEQRPYTGRPVEIAERLRLRQGFASPEGFVFLDSGRCSMQDHTSAPGRFSVIAINPWFQIRYQDGQTWINGQVSKDDLWTSIRKFLDQHATDLPDDGRPTGFPFQAGLLGYFAYDLAASLDPFHLTLPGHWDHEVPLAWLAAYDQMIVFDEQTKKACLIAWGQLTPVAEALENLRSGLDSCLNESPEVLAPKQKSLSEVNVRSNFTPSSYQERIGLVREAIGAGEVYILNLAQRLSLPKPVDAFRTFQTLRQKSPTPYAAYVEWPGLKILSFSPELFLKINDRKAMTRPIKGTRPRGQTPETDAQNAQELLSSAKDRAELLMIVDLERNDLSRVCTPESVKVQDLYALEAYATVYHLVATVSGELAPAEDAVSCFAALFPGGSITGAPKMRAMQLISEYETVRRGLYTGCLGFFSLDGQAEFNILIRTIIDSDRATTYHAGGGITWDSDPAAEYQETLDKTAAIAEAFVC